MKIHVSTYWWGLFFLFGCSGVAWSQSPLNQVIDYSVEEVSIEKALYHLMEVAEVDIAFINNIFPPDKRVSLTVRQQTVGYVLGFLLQDEPVGIELVADQIVIVLKKQPPPSRYTVSGYLTDQTSGEPLIAANIYTNDFTKGTETNQYGFYSLTLPQGRIRLNISYLGYQSKVIPLNLSQDLALNVELVPSLTLDSIVIIAPVREELRQGPRLSTNTFNLEELEQLPALGGESDLIRLAYTMPGVQTGADGFGGLTVRGGNVDQNLILMDGVPIYNSSHLLGIFSVFNSSAVRSAKLIKGGFPARYGGRVSSVLDVRTKEGNLKNYEAEADIGLTSGKFSLEGPIVKEKSSFFITARRSFIDFFSKPISRRLRAADGANGVLGYYFYDFNAKLNTQLSSRDRLFFSLYNGSDNYSNQIQFNQVFGDSTLIDDIQTRVHWGNTIASLRWNHQFSNKLFANTILTYSRFFYESEDLVERLLLFNFQPASSEFTYLTYKSNNRDLAAKIDLDYVPTPDHYIRFGASYTGHKFQPGAVRFDEMVQRDSINDENISGLLNKNPLYSNELELYVEDEWQVADWLWVNLGMRALVYHVLDYTQLYWQPRIQASVQVLPRLQLFGSAGRAVQPLHLLSNSGVGFPRDLWVSATPRIAPVESWQFVVGTHYRLDKQTEITLEGYYKKLDNLITFQEGSLIQIDGLNWQNKVATGQGWSYGGEFQLRRVAGKMTGWFSYTLAFADRQFEEVNLGIRYPFKFDRRHNFQLQTAYAINEKWTASLGWTFSTGAATTLPLYKYLDNQLNLLYSNLPPQFPFVLEAIDFGRRNDVRLPNYHRMDVQFNYRIRRDWGVQTLSFGFYNVYNRLNPFNYILADRPNEAGDIVPQYLQISLVPILPFLRYRLELDF